MILPQFPTTAKRLGYKARWLATSLGLQLSMFGVELLGIASIVPVVAYLQKDQEGEGGDLFGGAAITEPVDELVQSLGIDGNLALLLMVSFLLICLRQAILVTNATFVVYIKGRVTRSLRSRGLRAYFAAQEDVRSASEKGELLNNLVVEPTRACASISAGLNTINHLVVLSGYVVLVLLISGVMGVVGAMLSAAIALVLIRLFRSLGRLGALFTEANQVVSSLLMTRLAAARLVRLARLEQIELARFEPPLETQRARELSLTFRLNLLRGCVEPMIIAVAFSLVFFGERFNLVAFGDLVLLLMVLIRVVPITREVLVARQSYIASRPAADAILTSIQLLEDGREECNGTLSFPEKADVRFNNVCYQYPRTDGPALSDVSLTVPYGRFTAIVGPSGAGKSTLIDLLPSIRRPVTGIIKFGGVEQRKIKMTALRESIAFAPQFPQMFDVSVGEFIRFGWASASDDDVRDAARRARALSFIEKMPLGFDSPIGDGGELLSGGQRRRLDLARALLSRSPVLILDEPNAHLDPESEEKMMEALAELRAEGATTIIMVTHQLRSIHDVDQVVVMENGHVTVAGTADEAFRASDWLRLHGAAPATAG